MKMREG
jgi:hypothetical protein